MDKGIEFGKFPTHKIRHKWLLVHVMKSSWACLYVCGTIHVCMFAPRQTGANDWNISRDFLCHKTNPRPSTKYTLVRHNTYSFISDYLFPSVRYSLRVYSSICCRFINVHINIHIFSVQMMRILVPNPTFYLLPLL